MPNLLTTQVGLKLGPIVLETFFKHYLERKSEIRDADGLERSTNLRHDELLWQEGFEIVKTFLNQATKHTVEELQEFSNVRIPTPPWIWVKQAIVPMASCDVAATHLIKALGGEEVATRVVGGTKWWQVRGVRGVDCQWICQKSHMRTARKRKREKNGLANRDGSRRSPSSPRFSSFRKFSSNKKNSHPVLQDDIPAGPLPETHENHEAVNDKEIDITDMDGTRCLLYAHGGGYYFGSIDQERYCMQRYARKINGRVFACNYRLAPQYPFPCAIQDVLAAYLYLIDPPAEASHAPIAPESIVLGGDSAGGGLCLAVLQVMRDSGVPLPAGAVLISPWSDLTHSFPSIVQNTATDILPQYGLSLHRPSVLWPPPPDEISSRVRAGLRAPFQKVGRRAAIVGAFISPDNRGMPQRANNQVEQTGGNPVAQVQISNLEPLSGNGQHKRSEYKDTSRRAQNTSAVSKYPQTDEKSQVSVVVGRPPFPWESSDSIHYELDGESVAINSQIQLYCPNSLLAHPLVSPALSYLGGLPPLLVIASDKEVLRDEIIYVAHKAAHPDQFPVSEHSKELYPSLKDIGDKYGPTSVHLQVYDETAHVLPLFSFTTPAKYCYRTIASFIKHITAPLGLTQPLLPFVPQTDTPDAEDSTHVAPENIPLPSTPNFSSPSSPQISETPPSIQRVSSLWRLSPSLITKRNLMGTSRSLSSDLKYPSSPGGEDPGDVAGGRLKNDGKRGLGLGTAGDPSAYAASEASPDLRLGSKLIRERVSTQGIIRPLEPESELAALQLPSDHIGKVSEAVVRRYIEGHGIWTKKFAKTAEKIEKQRQKNLELAKQETIRTVETMAQYQEQFFREQDALDSSGRSARNRRYSALSLFRSQGGSDHGERQTWGWAWALDGERPPPSSIVSRRDTLEARNLARVADLSVGQEESKMSGNMLWGVLVNFLTAQRHRDEEGGDVEDLEEDKKMGSEGTTAKMGPRIYRRIKSFGTSAKGREQSSTAK